MPPVAPWPVQYGNAMAIASLGAEQARQHPQHDAKAGQRSMSCGECRDQKGDVPDVPARGVLRRAQARFA